MKTNSLTLFTRILHFLPVIGIGWLAAASPAFAQKDAKAKDLLDKSSAMLNQSAGISVAFTMNINDDVQKIKQSFEGRMLVKAAKFFLETPDQTVWFDGKTQWVYAPSVEEVTVLTPQPQDIRILNPIAVFELYKTNCDYKYNGEKIDGQKRSVQDISLFLRDKKEDVKQVDIQLSAGDGMPVFFRIVYKNKSEYKIYVTTYQTNVTLSDSQFVFDKKKYPQAEVNDLR